MDDLFLIYALVTSVLLLSGVLILVIGYFFSTIKKIRLYQKDIERIENDIVHHNKQAIDRARQKAEEIITAANTRAREIIQQTNKLEDETHQAGKQIAEKLLSSQKEELERARDQLFNQYKTLLENLYQDNVNLFRSISKDIETQAVLEVEDFKNILRRETLESQKIVGKRIDKLYADTQIEVEQYKKQELQKVQDNIYKIIENAVVLAIGKSIDFDKHEDLVMEALEEAIKNQESKSK